MTIPHKANVPYIETPLVYSKILSDKSKSSCKIYLKQDFIQPSGSYKLRGLSHHIKTELDKLNIDNVDSRIIKVIAASGGNAGNAISYAAAFYNLDSFIVVPETTSLMMRDKITANGSSVIVQGDNIGAADDYAKTCIIPQMEAKGFKTIYCHPYDIANIWVGHASIVDEIVSSLKKTNQLHNLKGIICSVGGGGLYNGILNGLDRNNLSSVPIMTLETDSCPTFQEAIKANKSVQIKTFNTIAVSLACPFISSKALENYRTHKSKNVLVTDEQAASSCLKFANDMSTIVEPACGVALCSIYDGIIQKNTEFFGDLDTEDIIIIIVCGGSGTSIDDLLRYKQTYQL